MRIVSTEIKKKDLKVIRGEWIDKWMKTYFQGF